MTRFLPLFCFIRYFGVGNIFTFELSYILIRGKLNSLVSGAACGNNRKIEWR